MDDGRSMREVGRAGVSFRQVAVDTPARKDARYIFLILVDSFSHTTCLEPNLLLHARH